jgi:site-specific recombinase XerD
VKLDKFILSISVSSDSKHTRRAYLQPLVRFRGFLSIKGLRIDQVNRDHIIEFVDHLKECKGRTKGETLAPATINLYLTAVSLYFDWRNSELDSRRPNPVRLIKRPRVRNKNPKPVDDVILTKLIDGTNDLRDRAMIFLFLFSGLRLSEVEMLNRNSISLCSHSLPDGSSDYYGVGKVRGKGGKEREFIVGPIAMLAIRDYLRRSRAGDDLVPLFLSSRKTRLSNRSMEQVLAKWCSRLNLDHIHPHRLRHSYATRNIEAGMSLVTLAKLMGHESVAVTERYVKISRARLKREYYAAMESMRESHAA